MCITRREKSDKNERVKNKLKNSVISSQGQPPHLPPLKTEQFKFECHLSPVLMLASVYFTVTMSEQYAYKRQLLAGRCAKLGLQHRNMLTAHAVCEAWLTAFRNKQESDCTCSGLCLAYSIEILYMQEADRLCSVRSLATSI